MIHIYDEHFLSLQIYTSNTTHIDALIIAT
jgi:hypothetical protein